MTGITQLRAETTHHQHLGTRSASELLAQARLGSAAAYEQLFRENFSVGINRAYQLVRDRGVAEEIATEAFARVYDAMTRGLGPQTTFRGYYLTAVRNVAVQRIRSAAARKELPTDDVEIHAPAVHDAIAELEHAERVRQTESVRQALASMPERMRSALQLSIVVGHTPEQIGETFGINAGAAAALTYRARKAFRHAYLASDTTYDARPHGR